MPACVSTTTCPLASQSAETALLQLPPATNVSTTFVRSKVPPPVGVVVIVQVKDAEPLNAGEPLSVTRTTTLDVPVVVGVPLITPVDAAMLSPAGSPVAENCMV